MTRPDNRAGAAGTPMHRENSDVSPLVRSVAVAVICDPTGTLASEVVKLAMPSAPVVTPTMPREVLPSPKPLSVQLEFEKTQYRTACLAGY